jgi:hypothetical protein
MKPPLALLLAMIVVASVSAHLMVYSDHVADRFAAEQSRS